MAANQAKVESIDVLERFRADLIIFQTKARRGLDTAFEEVRRTQSWLQNDRRMFWQAEIRRRRKVFEQAEADLYSARLSGMKESASVKRVAVNKARHALEEAEAKLKNVKKWTQRFGNLADPLLKRLEPLRQIVDFDMKEAIAFLYHAQRTLEAYREVALAASGGAAAVEEMPAAEAAPAPETTEGAS